MLKIIDMRRGKDSDLFEKLVGRDSVGRQDVVDTVNEILENVRKTETGRSWTTQRDLTGWNWMPHP